MPALHSSSSCPTRRWVLLDIDGTLVDSNDLHAEAWVEALRARGFQASFAQLRPLIGMGGDKVIPLLTGHDAESEVGKRLSEERTRLFVERYLPKVRPFPGVRELLEALRAAGHSLIVATSAKEQELGGLLRQGGIEDLLPQRTSSDDAEESKPDPDIVKAALRRARIEPSAAIMLGDTPYDLQAATQAGVPFVGLSSGGYAPEAMSAAIAVYRDAAELLERLRGSPLAPPRQ